MNRIGILLRKIKYRRMISLAAVTAAAVCTMLFGAGRVDTLPYESGAYGYTLSDHRLSKNVFREKLSAGTENIIKRGRQMYEITWEAQADITGYPGTEEDFVFRKGAVYKGIPYGQPVHKGKYVGFGASLEDFAENARDASSPMYTDRGENTWYYTEGLGDIKYAPYYSSDCSAFISYVWDLPGRFTTAMIAEDTARPGEKGYGDAVYQYVGSDVSDLRTGYALNKGGSHIILVYDVLYDMWGNTVQVTTLEQTPPMMRLRVWGEGGNAGSLEDLQLKIDSSPYDIIRYRDMDSVGFEESPAVTLEYGGYMNTVSAPVSDRKASGAVIAEAYTGGSDFTLEGWTQSDTDITGVEYSTDGENWTEAEAEEQDDITRFRADVHENEGAAAGYTLFVRALCGGGSYSVAEIKIHKEDKDMTCLTYFDAVNGLPSEVLRNEPYRSEISLDDSSGYAVSFTGWALSTDGIKGFEYRIDDGMWIPVEAGFRQDVYRLYKTYDETCDVYNRFTGSADLTAYAPGSDHTLYIRAVTDSSAYFEMAEINVRIAASYTAVIAVSAAFAIVCAIIVATVISVKRKKGEEVRDERTDN